MVSLPTPFRAAVGLVATVVDEAKRLPDRALEIPMLAVSSALQMSLRAQQQYAALAVRGDEVLSRREVTDEPPAWAQFDDASAAAGAGPLNDDAALAVSVADLVDDVQTGTADPALVAIVDPAEDDPLHAAAPDAQPILDQRAGESSVFGADLPQPAADGVAESDGPAEGGADFEAGSTGEVRPGPLRSGGKTVRAPRNARPSRFDVVGDE